MEKFFDSFVFLPLSRLYLNIYQSALLNGIIFLSKILGENNTQITHYLRGHPDSINIIYAKENNEYKGGLVLVWQPLFGKPFIHFDKGKAPDIDIPRR